MNSLKFALSTQESPTKVKGDVDGSLLKGVNKSKNQSLWAFDLQNNEQATQQSLNTDNFMKILNQKLQIAFQKDSKSISDIAMQRIVEEFQDEAGGSKSQLSYLMVIEDKLTDILDFAKDDFRKYCEMFNELISLKISKLKKKEKKSELNNFDKIVSGNFKKKIDDTPYLTVQNGVQPRKSREKDRLCSKSPSKKENSSENKLARLFSKEKKTIKEKDFKDSIKREDEGGINMTQQQEHEQSVSFTAVLSTTTVKSRRRKDSIGQKPKKAKQKKNEHAQEDKQEGDQAFIFFRPKKGKK